MKSTQTKKQNQSNLIPAKRVLPLRIDVLLIVVAIVLGNCTNSLYSQPLKLGQSVVTSYDEANDNFNAVKILDYRNQPAYSAGGHYWDANEYIGPNWKHSRMGNVFGITIDDAVPPNIYVARSTVYSQTSRLNYPGLIYKIDGATWNVIDYVSKSNSAGPPVIGANTIPNTNPGLGNICYDKWHKQLFVTNHEDGMIYQIKDNGTGLLGIVKDVFDPFSDDVPSNGFVQRGERIWGIGVFGRSSADVRVYFGRWKSDYGYQTNGANEIWSVALDYSGNFIKSSERIEITLPLYSSNYSSPPADIEFSLKGDMAISEKSMNGEFDLAHISRNLIFPRNINNKYDNANFVRHNIGIYSQKNNSCGGIDFEYGHIDSTTNSYQECDSVVVGTGDYLYFRPGYGVVYGVQFSEKQYGGSNNYMDYSHYTDLNGIYGTQDKMTPGDVDVYRKNSCSCNMTDSLYIKDSPNDAGLEPNYQTGSVMWDSKDIWVCNDPASNCTSHSNPSYNPPFKSYVKVRVRNENGSPSCGGVLTLQWAKASTGLAWPKPWDASVNYGNNNLQMGGLIGSKSIPAIGPYSTAVVSFEWTPPNPDVYFNDFQGDKGHFCLLARIETSEDAPYGMTYPETNDLYSNVKNNKKIAWKNVEVVNGLMPVYKPVWFYVGNPKPMGAIKKFEFNVANGNSFFANATVTTKLSGSLYQKWAAGGKQGSNVIELADSSIKILGNGAYITNLFLDSNSIHEMNINFLRDSKPDSTLLPVYEVDVVQHDVNQNRIEGGNRFSISTAVPVSVSIKVAIEGLYYGNSSDTVKAFLRNNTSPYSIVDSASSVIDPSNNYGQFLFANAPSGNYYIQIKHRNSIETWSSQYVAYTFGNTLNYDFTSSASQAYGNNLVQVDTSPVVFAVYSGDVNQDGTVDGADGALIDNDASNFVSGYVVTDLNGDGFVDGSDFAIADNNAFNFVSMIRP